LAIVLVILGLWASAFCAHNDEHATAELVLLANVAPESALSHEQGLTIQANNSPVHMYVKGELN
jgi:hypothetical protein